MIDIRSISPVASLGPDGIWYGTVPQPVSYPADGHESVLEIEDDSYWFQHRNACIIAAALAFSPPAGAGVFDIGGGNGYVSRGLQMSGFDVALIEPGYQGARNAKRRGIRTVLCGTTDTLAIRGSSLGAIGLFDVIEHVADDRSFLVDMRRLIQPGGRLYATVPAYSLLWSALDDSVGHHRRYMLKGVCDVLRQAGFAVDFATYLFSPLPGPILLLRSLPYRLGLSRTTAHVRRKARRDHSVTHGTAGRVARKLLQREVRRIGQHEPMRFGGSCLVVASAR
jgi:SAM-dependent methyltransferase